MQFTNKSENSEYWTYAAISCFVVRGLRRSLNPGLLHFADLIEVLPFGNRFDVVELQGKDLLQVNYYFYLIFKYLIPIIIKILSLIL